MRVRMLQLGVLAVLSVSIPLASAQVARLRTASHPTPVPIVSPSPHFAPAPPPYLILRQTTGGVAQPTIGQPYAYGWFGAAPRRHTITHRGYYGSHWLWPGRIAP